MNREFDIKSIRVPRVGTDSVPKVGTVEKKFARVPKSVFSDPELGAADVRVYCAMASKAFYSGALTSGLRALAKAACTSLSQAKRSVDRLMEAGHVKRWDERKGFRNKYMLTSPVFSGRQGLEDTVVYDPVSGVPRLATIMSAPRRKAIGR